MGMFTQKPEEPAEWAGLPSEPVRRDDTDLEPAVGTELLLDGTASSIGIELSAYTVEVEAGDAD
ncbi:hypothetical protein [Microbacterium nymphoidis]|uniref:hypothetical protein n=1 Tax=Microbacterium nymphoidis TaxID=2898586 RepID=UPI001E48FCE5|nr:hypothetical protein [Microbacterium nymphoidis]MCD2499972.1 hypothetical protein [Microbacterium nymphoidis]